MCNDVCERMLGGYLYYLITKGINYVLCECREGSLKYLFIQYTQWRKSLNQHSWPLSKYIPGSLQPVNGLARIHHSYCIGYGGSNGLPRQSPS